MLKGKKAWFMQQMRSQSDRVHHLLKWLVVAGTIGVVIGLVGAAFYHGMVWVNEMRREYPWLIFGLPFVGLIIVFLYRITGREKDCGTNSIIAAVRSEEELNVVMAPLIFVSTLLSHLCGGSVGREGAALQLGGSLGSGLGKIFRLKEIDMQSAVMCGMSACFAVLFGTPLAATVFSMEVVNVGIMQYSALVPCVFSSLIAMGVAGWLGVEGEVLSIAHVPDFTFMNAGKMVFIAALCASVSIVFCIMMHRASKWSQKWIVNPYRRVFSVALVIIGINILLGTTDYMGAGMEVIERAMHGEARPEAFLMKMILTAMALGVGFKGGEIVPSFFVGATFGCVLGQFLGVSPSMCAAVGMIAVFCGVTNSPITALLIAVELFGLDGIYFMLMGVAVSYMLSGYYSLYDTQKIVVSKYTSEYRKKWLQ